MGTTRVLLPRGPTGLATVGPEVENFKEHGEEGEDAVYHFVSFFPFLASTFYSFIQGVQF